MAKRANPFTEDFVQQSKVHVGIKQFNSSEERLQKVYEKTLELLFKGAKKSEIPLNREVAEMSPHDVKTNMKQLFISKDGTLLHSGEVLDKPSIRQCGCGCSDEMECGYCESPLCAACQHPCTICQQPYCSRCSLFGSDGEYCVSCYG